MENPSLRSNSNNIVFKAVNQDNDAEIKSLVDLFHRSYDEIFPVTQAYLSHFWKSRIGNTLVSLVAEIDGQMVAHVGMCPDREQRHNVQICIPAFDPALGELRGEIAQLMWYQVEKMAERQNWKMAYKLLVNCLPEVQNIIIDQFNFTEVSIYPGHKPKNAAKSRNSQVRLGKWANIPTTALAEKVFNPNVADEKMCIYAPKQHMEMIKYLYEPLGLPRKFIVTSKDEIVITADQPSVELLSYPQTGIAHIFIQPSLFDRYNTNVFDLARRKFDDFLILVNAFDTKTPEYCAFLEKEGFAFSGVLPLLHNQDSIVYTRPSNIKLDIGEMASDRAKKLADYMEDYTSSNTAITAPRTKVAKETRTQKQ